MRKKKKKVAMNKKYERRKTDKKKKKKKQVSFNVSMCQDQLLVDTISSSKTIKKTDKPTGV